MPNKRKRTTSPEGALEILFYLFGQDRAVAKAELRRRFSFFNVESFLRWAGAQGQQLIILSHVGAAQRHYVAADKGAIVAYLQNTVGDVPLTSLIKEASP